MGSNSNSKKKHTQKSRTLHTTHTDISNLQQEPKKKIPHPSSRAQLEQLDLSHPHAFHNSIHLFAPLLNLWVLLQITCALFLTIRLVQLEFLDDESVHDLCDRLDELEVDERWYYVDYALLYGKEKDGWIGYVDVVGQLRNRLYKGYYCIKNGTKKRTL